MATKNDFEVARTALALVQANKAEDEAAILAVLSMVRESEIGDFLVALAEMVHFAHGCDPGAGWEAFSQGFAAAIDRAEASQ